MRPHFLELRQGWGLLDLYGVSSTEYDMVSARFDISCSRIHFLCHSDEVIKKKDQSLANEVLPLLMSPG